jgi:pyruvate/2-oxoglutarate dehydrogenase complex dihydrolipoamide acyltransferase (E2) component
MEQSGRVTNVKFLYRFYNLQFEREQKKIRVRKGNGYSLFLPFYKSVNFQTMRFFINPFIIYTYINIVIEFEKLFWQFARIVRHAFGDWYTLQGGTFMVSSLLAAFVVSHNDHLPAFASTWAAERRVIPGSGGEEFKFASFMAVTLSCDHRVIDGNYS